MTHLIFNFNMYQVNNITYKTDFFFHKSTKKICLIYQTVFNISFFYHKINNSVNFSYVYNYNS